MSKIRKIGLGTAQFGIDYGISNVSGKTPANEVKRIIETCLDNGISILDTASAYGDAEKVLGEIGIAGFKIVSKFMPTDTSEQLKNQLFDSLINLNISQLYGYLAHRPLDLLANNWTWKFLQDQKSSGRIKKIGYSLNSTFELQKLLDSNIIPDIIQLPYNFLDRRFEKYFEYFKQNGVEIHARSVFLQGLFFSDVSNLHSFFNPVKDILIELQRTTPNYKEELLDFVLANPDIDFVIMGVETSKQLLQNLKNACNDYNHLKSKVPRMIDEKILVPSNWPK